MNAPLRVLQLATCGLLYGAERWILALIRNLDPALVESHVAVIIDQPEAEAPLLAARGTGAHIPRWLWDSTALWIKVRLLAKLPAGLWKRPSAARLWRGPMRPCLPGLQQAVRLAQSAA